MDLSIIIINWNSTAYLKECLASVYGAETGMDFEVIVIDNASFDGCGEMLAAEFPQVRFIQSEQNLGFVRANNLGFEHSSGRNVLFLNPDTEVIGSALEQLVSVLDSDLPVGIVGPRLLNSDLTVQTSCIQRFPTIVNQLLDTDYLREKFPRARLWGTQPLWESSQAPVEVEVIPGACLMIRREAFERAGHFSLRYFMYSEDVDLCYEVRKAGWEVAYLGNAQVVHHGGKSSGSSQQGHFSDVMIRESVARFLRSKRGRVYAALYRLTMAAASLLRSAFVGASLLQPLSNERRTRRVVALNKWLKILRWSVGLEGWARKAGPQPSVSANARTSCV